MSEKDRASFEEWYVENQHQPFNLANSLLHYAFQVGGLGGFRVFNYHLF